MGGLGAFRPMSGLVQIWVCISKRWAGPVYALARPEPVHEQYGTPLSKAAISSVAQVNYGREPSGAHLGGGDQGMRRPMSRVVAHQILDG